MSKICIYPGSFDPITKGHEWIIEEAAKLFDVVVVAVARNASKKSRFSAETRFRLVNESPVVKALGAFGHVEVVQTHDMFTVDVARQLKATHIVRGIRSGVDFDYERTIDLVNRDIARTLGIDISTVYLTPPKELAEVSSSMVMSLVGIRGWEKVVDLYVSPHVAVEIKKWGVP